MFYVNHTIAAIICVVLLVDDGCATTTNNLNKLLSTRGLIAQCRASCIERFTVERSSIHHLSDVWRCNNWQCHMCWDYCENIAIHVESLTPMCNDEICLEGCQQACKFHKSHPILLSASMSTFMGRSSEQQLRLDEPKVTKTDVVISWTIRSRERLVFVVLGALHTTATEPTIWEEIQQTAERQLMLHKDSPKYAQIIVVAFNSGGSVQSDSKKMVFKLQRHPRDVSNALQEQFVSNNLLVIISVFLLLFSVCCAFAMHRKVDSEIVEV